MAEPLIRPFEEPDRAGLIRLWELCGLTCPWNDPDRDIDRKLALADDLLFVAICGAETQRRSPSTPLSGTARTKYSAWVSD